MPHKFWKNCCLLVYRSSCRLLCSRVMPSKTNMTQIHQNQPTRSASTSVLIVGLGNYDMAETRHSVGMIAVDGLAQRLGITWTKNKQFQAFIAKKAVLVKSTNSETDSGDETTLEVVLLKSTLPMNLNGRSVVKAVHSMSIPASQVYLIHDELDKPVGKFSIKESGSARGHNGVRSVFDCLHTDVIPRLRIGIDRPANQSDVTRYVLQRFTSEEREIMELKMTDMLTLMLRHVETKLGFRPRQLVMLITNSQTSDGKENLDVGSQTFQH